MPRIMPITDLRNTNEISNICHSANEPVFVTKNGYGDMVIMSMEAYDNLMETIAADAAIAASEADLNRNGILHDSKDVFAGLRRKYGE